MFSDSLHRRLARLTVGQARQDLPAHQISANLSRRKLNCFVETKCAGKKIFRCQGVASAKPAGKAGLDIYFLEFFGTFCFKTKRTIKKQIVNYLIIRVLNRVI
jgi:hypothetical protein